MNFLGAATGLDYFLKAYKTSETKKFFPYEWFDHPDKIQNPELPPYDAFYSKIPERSTYDAFYSKLRSCNPLETEYTDYVNLLKSRLTTEQAVIKLKLSKPPYWNWELSLLLTDMEARTNKDFVPTLKAMQKMISFYHDKDIDMLKLACTLLNLANICLHKSTNAKFYPFTERDKDLLEKTREVVGGPSIVFTSKAVVDKTFIRNSTNICKSIVGIDSS